MSVLHKKTVISPSKAPIIFTLIYESRYRMVTLRDIGLNFYITAYKN